MVFWHLLPMSRVFFYSLSKFITKLDETLDCEHAAIMSGVVLIAFVVKGSTWVCVCVCYSVFC